MSVALVQAAFFAATYPEDFNIDPKIAFVYRVEEAVAQLTDDPRWEFSWGTIMGDCDGIAAATVCYRGQKFYVFKVPGAIREGAMSRYVYEVEPGDPRS